MIYTDVGLTNIEPTQFKNRKIFELDITTSPISPGVENWDDFSNDYVRGTGLQPFKDGLQYLFSSPLFSKSLQYLILANP